MSLLDALLVDPVRIDVWIAYRTDGVAGSGTQNDPYDGSTIAKFDTLMGGMAVNTCVHLGPGEFQTAGYYDGLAGSGWQPKSGMRIVGSGIDVTTLKLVNSTATTTQRVYAVAHELSASTVDHFELSDMTIDCNLGGVSGSASTAGVPVVATDYSACPGLVRGRGELVRPAAMVTVGVNLIEHAVIDVDDLAAKIEGLREDAARWRRYSEAGVEFARSLSWDVLMAQWQEVLGVPPLAATRTGSREGERD